jgi:hypothetical protein
MWGVSDCRVEQREDYVVVRVVGEHDIAAAVACSREVVRIVADPRHRRMRASRARMVVDISEVTDFPADAQRLWWETLQPLCERIASLTVVGGSPLARLACASICLVAGIENRNAESLSEVLGRGAIHSAHP